MPIKKREHITTKKSDSRKKTIASSSKTKSDSSKQTFRKKWNEPDDNHSL
jgi:hypothetical protein